MRNILYLCCLLSALCSPVWALRIVSLLPSNTEILESLGAGGDVVGVTRYDGRLSKKPRIESVGDFMQPNMETIVSLHPDLIVAGLWTSSHIVPRLRSMHYTVLEIHNPDSFEELYGTIRTLARVSEHPDAADGVIRDMQGRVQKLQERARALPRRLRTYIEVDRPYWTIGGHDFLTEAFSLIGADNLFSDILQQAAQVSPEIILERNPDLIVSFQDRWKDLVRRPGWDALKAVQEGFIIDDISQDDLSRPSPRLVSGMEALLKRIEHLEKR